jgi:hypothetical protein
MAKYKMTQLFFIVGLLTITYSAFPQESEYKITKRDIPEQYKDIFNFLELLKWKPDDPGYYDIKSTPNWNTSEVMNYIASKGVLFIDPNDEFKKVLIKEQIEKELKKRTGKSFEMISHMSHIYSIPYKQYSELKFEQTDNNETVVYVASWYKLIFENSLNKHLLISCEYLQLEGE